MKAVDVEHTVHITALDLGLIAVPVQTLTAEHTAIDSQGWKVWRFLAQICSFTNGPNVAQRNRLV